jgi:hypothetical protein
MLATCTNTFIYQRNKLSYKDEYVNFLSAALALPKHKGGANDRAFFDGPN